MRHRDLQTTIDIADRVGTDLQLYAGWHVEQRIRGVRHVVTKDEMQAGNVAQRTPGLRGDCDHESLIAGAASPVSDLGAQGVEAHGVPYFVSWHGTARSFNETTNPNFPTDVDGSSEDWDTAGSAIVRLGFLGDHPTSALETHYLNMTVNQQETAWHERDHYEGNVYAQAHSGNHVQHCSFRRERIAAESPPGSFSGLTVHLESGEVPMLMSNGMSGEGATLAFSSPLIQLVDLSFIQRTVVNRDSCNPVEEDEPVGTVQTNAAVSWPFTGVPDLPRDPNNQSSFYIDRRYTDVVGGQYRWIAHAYPLGKCAERDGPIDEGDSIITHEDVDVETEQPVITPDGDGKAYVTIRVTCDHVPIQNAPVEVKLDVVENSGYHQHSPDRPLGQLDGQEMKKDSILKLKTDADGYAYAPSSKTKSVKFEPPPLNKATDYAGYGAYLIGIAGTYKVTAKTTSKKVPESRNTVAITAKVEGLVQMDTSSGASYVIDRNAGDHKIGSWGKQATLDAFKNLATDVQKYQQLHTLALVGCGEIPWMPVYPVSLNDIALPDGGLFDANSNWKPPKHQTHNRGEGGDFNRFGFAAGGALALGTGKDCKGKTVRITPWLIHTLLDLGQPYYGKWDCGDLGPAGCVNAEPPPDPWIPQSIHLHVGDVR